MNKHYRQGDVVLVEVDSLPAGAAKESDGNEVVLAWGEVTGHSHRLQAPEGVAYFALSGTNYFEIKHPSQLVHEEHDAIALSPGFYKVVRQREYTPERIVRVID